jgi:hypothetical protein
LCPFKRKLKREVELDWLRSFPFEPINQIKMTKAAAIDEHPSFLTMRPQVYRIRGLVGWSRSALPGNIYRAVKVAEVWRFDGTSLVIEQLRPDGTHAVSDSSRFLPVRSDEVLRWIRDEDSSDELACELRLREWARTELTPRAQP